MLVFAQLITQFHALVVMSLNKIYLQHREHLTNRELVFYPMLCDIIRTNKQIKRDNDHGVKRALAYSLMKNQIGLEPLSKYWIMHY